MEYCEGVFREPAWTGHATSHIPWSRTNLRGHALMQDVGLRNRASGWAVVSGSGSLPSKTTTERGHEFWRTASQLCNLYSGSKAWSREGLDVFFCFFFVCLFSVPNILKEEVTRFWWKRRSIKQVKTNLKILISESVGGKMAPGVRSVQSGQTFVQQPQYLNSG